MFNPYYSSTGSNPDLHPLLGFTMGLTTGLAASLGVLSISASCSPEEKKKKKQLKLESSTEILQWRAMGKTQLSPELMDIKKEDKKSTDELQKLFRKMDLDSDGKIDKDELRVFLIKIGDIAVNNEISGSKSLTKFVGIPTLTGYMSPTRYQRVKLENKLNQLMEKYDINNDKALDEYEFWALCNDYLASYIPMRLQLL
eukprot:jgi/Bigna1/89579/estExt_fgenesh1_pg.C_520012